MFRGKWHHPGALITICLIEERKESLGENWRKKDEGSFSTKEKGKLRIR